MRRLLRTDLGAEDTTKEKHVKKKNRKEKRDPKFFKRSWGIEWNSNWILRRMKPCRQTELLQKRKHSEPDKEAILVKKRNK